MPTSSKEDKIIFRDFNHWFGTSKEHNTSSFSREWMRRIWHEILPTIEASQDDYKRAYIKLMREASKDRSEMVDLMLEYIEEHKQPGQMGFFRWWSSRLTEEAREDEKRFWEKWKTKILMK